MIFFVFGEVASFPFILFLFHFSIGEFLFGLSECCNACHIFSATFLSDKLGKNRPPITVVCVVYKWIIAVHYCISFY
nr:MAG TPA: hypothetical protein [Caudoviricetes sp.]